MPSRKHLCNSRYYKWVGTSRTNNAPFGIFTTQCLEKRSPGTGCEEWAHLAKYRITRKLHNLPFLLLRSVVPKVNYFMGTRRTRFSLSTLLDERRTRNGIIGSFLEITFLCVGLGTQVLKEIDLNIPNAPQNYLFIVIRTNHRRRKLGSIGGGCPKKGLNNRRN